MQRFISNNSSGGDSNSSVLRRMDHKEPRIQYTDIFEKNNLLTENHPLHIKRVCTIAYRIYPDRKSMNVEFGASIFRNDAAFPNSEEGESKEHPVENDGKPKREVYIRKHHISTSRGRLEKRPVFVTYDIDEKYNDVLLKRPVRLDLKKVPRPKDFERLPQDKQDEWTRGREEYKRQQKEWLDRLNNDPEYIRWAELRDEFDAKITKFLRSQVGKHSTGAAIRPRRSAIDKARQTGKFDKLFANGGGRRDETIAEWLSDMRKMKNSVLNELIEHVPTVPSTSSHVTRRR